MSHVLKESAFHRVSLLLHAGSADSLGVGLEIRRRLTWQATTRPNGSACLRGVYQLLVSRSRDCEEDVARVVGVEGATQRGVDPSTSRKASPSRGGVLLHFTRVFNR